MFSVGLKSIWTWRVVFGSTEKSPCGDSGAKVNALWSPEDEVIAVTVALAVSCVGFRMSTVCR